MTAGSTIAVVALAVLVAVLAAVPWLVSDYGLGFMVNLMCYLVLTIAWAVRALRQAFAAPPAAFRAAVGASLLFEFYETAARFDVDVSQVVVERLSSVRAAGRRRFSLGVTVRM